MSKKDRLVLEITPQDCYNPFRQWGDHITNYDVLWTEDAKKVALVVFTGGTDVNPSLYGEKRGSRTDHPDKERDEKEQNIFYRANTLGIPMAGICRGSQFLCVMAGGRLAQDITNHGRYHTIRTHDNHVIECNSTHHQMQLPPQGARILAMAEPRLSKHYYDGQDKDIEVPGEVEVVHYPNIQAVGIQYHPEWIWHDDPRHPCVLYSQQVVKEFLFADR